MKLALLGADEETLAVVAGALADEVDRLVWACDVGPRDADVERLAPLARRTDDWESLLEPTLADAVIVARGNDDALRLDQMRKLLQAGLPLLVAQPIHDSALDYYELEMVRGEARAVLLPLLTAREHPAVADVWEALAEPTPVGPLEQVTCERYLADRDPRAVRAAFARDIDLIRALAGEMNRLVAMSPAVENRYANLGVQLSGPAGVVARWNVAPIEQTPGLRVTLVGRRGKLVLWLADDGAATLDDAHGGPPRRRTYPAPHAGRVMIDKLRRAAEETRHAPAGETTASRWLDAARNMELTEAIARSLARGRMIEIRDDNRSESEAFKSIMASLGCGLLLLAPLVLIGGELAAQAGVPLVGNLKWLLLLLLGVFLLLQLLGGIVPRETKAG